MPRPAFKRCACGWLRPVIAITTLRGVPPEEPDLVPVYVCPKCGKSYVPSEIPGDVALAILRSLMGSDPN